MYSKRRVTLPVFSFLIINSIFFVGYFKLGIAKKGAKTKMEEATQCKDQSCPDCIKRAEEIKEAEELAFAFLIALTPLMALTMFGNMGLF